MLSEEELKQASVEFAKKNKEIIASELTDKSIYQPDDNPISIFMAGSPGAGKTEYSKNMIELHEKHKIKVIRIDGDELREKIPGYTGTNSSVIQGAISIIVDRIHDKVLLNNQSFLLDGTFSNFDRAVSNIKRSLRKNRPVAIFYIYQDPVVAWKFTQAREIKEGRNMPKEAFIQHFINARETILKLHTTFDKKISIIVIKKNFETHKVEDIIDIGQVTSEIDRYLGKEYTVNDLEKLL